MQISNKTLYPVGNSYQTIQDMQQLFDKLQVQLGTGKKAATLSELGSDRSLSLTLRDRLTRLDAYHSTIATINLRLDMFDNVLKGLDTLEADSRSAVMSAGAGTDGLYMVSASAQAKARLDQAVSLLNTDLNGRYMFGGNVTDKPPVVATDTLMNGDGVRDGFKTIAGQRQMADMGDDNMGRLDSVIDPLAADQLSLSEDGDHPFGLKLAAVSASGSAFTVTGPTGTPPDSLSVQATGTPAAGDKLTFTFNLPNGGLERIELTATDGLPEAGEFTVGATPDQTIANVKAALDARIQDTVTTKVRTASLYAAADNFFNGQGDAVQRVGGPDYYNATSLSAASAADTVFWYQGQDAASARDTVTAKADDSTIVRYGAQANETGPLQLVRSLAILAVDAFDNSDTTSSARYNYTRSLQVQMLSDSGNSTLGSIEAITLDLSIARAAVGSASERHKSYGVQLESMLTDVEGVSTNDVAAQLLQLQTRLQASYQAMSIVSGLSLVNYMS